MREHHRRDVAVAVSGGLAEMIAFGNYHAEGCEDDQRVAEAAAREFTPNVRKVIEHEQVRAARILKAHWPAVQALAAALLDCKTMDGDRAHRFILDAQCRPAEAA